MKISQREMMLGVVTLACVLGGFTWYVVDGKIDEWKARKTEIEKLRQQISFHQNAIQKQEDWLDDLNKLQQDLRVFRTLDRSVAPDLMKTIKSISSKHGLDILRSQPYPEKKIGDLFELGINCTWEGPLEAIVGFLTDIQQQGVRYDVRTLNITPAGNKTANLKGNMVIHCAYMRRPAEEQAEGRAP